jgi:hypothetical protein
MDGFVSLRSLLVYLPIRDNCLFRLPNIVFETVAFLAALWKTFRHFIEMKGSQSDDDRGNKSVGQRLMKVMFQDSLLYFTWWGFSYSEL